MKKKIAVVLVICLCLNNVMLIAANDMPNQNEMALENGNYQIQEIENENTVAESQIGDVIEEGACGDNLTYSIIINGKDESGEDTYLLKIEGEGDMYGYSPDYSSTRVFDTSSPGEYNKIINTNAPWGKYYERLNKLILSEGITGIGNLAFQGCGFTGELNIPSSVKSIGVLAFCGCGFTGTLNIPSNVVSIEIGAFESCTGFTGELNIPTSVVRIGGCAFYGCTGFSNTIYISESVREIGYSAFFDCTRVKEIYFKGNLPEIYPSAFHGIKADVFYPSGDSSWIDEALQNYGGELVWKPCIYTMTSIEGEGNKYLGGEYKYSSQYGKAENLSGDKIIKNTTWDINGEITIRDGKLYIRSGATVTVKGKLNVDEIVVEKGGKLSVELGGRVISKTITAKGGWCGDSGGKIWIKQGALTTEELNFEGQSTLLIHSTGKIIVKNILKMASGCADSSLEDGTIFIGNKLILKGNNKNFISENGNLNVVFYNNYVNVIEAKSDKFNLGNLYVTKEEIFTNMDLSSNNYANVSLCSVSCSGETDWTLKKGKSISTHSSEKTWSNKVENAFSGVAANQAFNCQHSQLTAEENQFVNNLAAVWINTLNAPLCEGFVEFQSTQYELHFEMNDKKCVLKCTGLIQGFSALASVYLNVNGSGEDILVGVAAKADVNEFSEKAQQYLIETAKEEFLEYVSGGIAGQLKKIFSWGNITESMVEIFIEEVAKKTCVNSDVLKTTKAQNIQDIEGSFKVLKFVVSTSTRTSSIEESKVVSNMPQDKYSSTINEVECVKNVRVAQAVQQLQPVSTVVTDKRLKEKLIVLLGTDSDGEPDFSKAGEIESLDLSNGYIKDLNGLQYFTNLKQLDVENNELTDLSPLAGLTNLEKLDVSGQFISSLYPISNLTSLISLDASENELVSLNFGTKLVDLQNLDISDNMLNTLDEIQELTSLKKITASNNPLNITDLYCLKGMNQLSELNLSVCNLTSIEGIQTDNLTELRLSNNQITDLEQLRNSKCLVLLDVSHNQIVDIEPLLEVTALTELNVSGNSLGTLTALGELRNIINLNASDIGALANDLNVLGKMKKLKSLDVSDNLIFGIGNILETVCLEEINISNTCIREYEIELMEMEGIVITNETKLPVIKEIYFLHEAVELNKGEQYWQGILSYPSKVELKNIQWTSSDNEIAVVDDNGIVTAMAVGEVTITAMSEDGTHIAFYVVNVEKNVLKGDVSTDASISMKDVQIIFSYLSKRIQLTEEQIIAGDVNGDGAITTNDMQRIFYYVNGKIAEL